MKLSTYAVLFFALAAAPSAFSGTLTCELTERNSAVESAGDSMDLIFKFNGDDVDQFSAAYRINVKRMFVPPTALACKNTFVWSEKVGDQTDALLFCGVKEEGGEAILALSIQRNKGQTKNIFGRVATHTGIAPYLAPGSDSAVRCNIVE